MPAMTTTTLSAAVALGDKTITVASATGITARYFGAATTLIYVDFELMEVESVTGTIVTVKRGISPTQASAHLSGAKVWLGPPEAFYNGNPSGAASTTTAGVYYPAIVPATREIYNIVGGLWVKESQIVPATVVNVGTVGTATGLTVAEYGDGINHQTKITLAATPVGTPVGAANLAIGVLVYTLPAGAIIVGGTSMSVALADVSVGALCIADTPDVGIGLLIGSGAQAVLSGVGATAENYLTGQTAAGCAAAYTDITLATVTTQVALAAADAHLVHLNVADGWAGAGTIKATGTIVLNWVYSAV